MLDWLLNAWRYMCARSASSQSSNLTSVLETLQSLRAAVKRGAESHRVEPLRAVARVKRFLRSSLPAEPCLPSRYTACRLLTPKARPRTIARLLPSGIRAAAEEKKFVTVIRGSPRRTRIAWRVKSETNSSMRSTGIQLRSSLWPGRPGLPGKSLRESRYMLR